MPGYWWKNLKETDHFDGLGIDGRIILKMNHKERGWERLDWINLNRKRQKWLTVVTTVMNILFP
jgi:hypothetical protein